MSVVARLVVMIVLGMLAACGVAVAGGTGDEVEQMQAAGTADRVLGKRAFDAAHSGYAPFQPLVGEAPRRTLVRAVERIGELERDLAVMHRHQDPAHASVTEDLARATALLGEARLALATVGGPGELDHAQLDLVIELIAEVQLVLHGAREERVLAAA